MFSLLIWLSSASSVPVSHTGLSGYDMLRIPAGSYTQGCTPGQIAYCHKTEKPAHSVTLTHDLWVGRTEVTQELYERVTGTRPQHFSGCGETCPVENVSWLDAVHFANALSSKEGLESCYAIGVDGVTWPKGVLCAGYRLPTEAEWEYAARGNLDLPYGHTSEVNEAGWTVANSGGRPHPVGELAPNAWGLYDMVGNVWEWTWDWNGRYARAASVDPLGPASPARRDPRRMMRGGSWAMFTSVATVSTRVGHAPDRRDANIGFRLVRTVVE